MCIITYNRHHVALDKLGDLIWKGEVASDKKIMHEGLYMFGGVYGESLTERRVNDKMMFLPVGDDVDHRWVEL